MKYTKENGYNSLPHILTLFKYTFLSEFSILRNLPGELTLPVLLINDGVADLECFRPRRRRLGYNDLSLLVHQNHGD